MFRNNLKEMKSVSRILKDILDAFKGCYETVWKYLNKICGIYVPRTFLKFNGIFLCEPLYVQLLPIPFLMARSAQAPFSVVR